MTELLTTIAVIFIIAGPFLLAANYLHLPVVPALIAAGLAASAGGLIDPALKLEIARLGIALLVFTFAVRIQTTDIRTAIADSEVVALVQLLLVGTIGFGCGLVLGIPTEEAIYLGIAGAISSSIVGSTLFLPGGQDLVHDKLSESIHSIQDFAALFLLLVVSAGVLELDPIATQLGYGVMLLLLAVAVNRYLYDAIGRFTGGATEPMLIGTIALLLVFLTAAEFTGISIVVGAFAAGVAVRNDPVAYSGVFNGLESVNDFFAAIFFITVGSLVTFPSTDVIWLTLLLVVLVGIIKPVVTIWLLMYRGYERRTATLTALNLDQVGEFALIIAIEALVLGLLTQSLFDAIILAAALTLVTSSFTRFYSETIYHRIADNGLLGRDSETVEQHSPLLQDISDHIVIVGYGRHGRRLVETCEAHDKPYVVIESNPALLEDLQSECSAYVFGDVVEPQTLEKAKLTHAQLVISTADTHPVNEHLVEFAESVNVIVRSENRANAREFLDKGAFYVGVSDLLAADRLGEQLAEFLEGNYDPAELRRQVAEDGQIQRAHARKSSED